MSLVGVTGARAFVSEHVQSLLQDIKKVSPFYHSFWLLVQKEVSCLTRQMFKCHVHICETGKSEKLCTAPYKIY